MPYFGLACNVSLTVTVHVSTVAEARTTTVETITKADIAVTADSYDVRMENVVVTRRIFAEVNEKVH